MTLGRGAMQSDYMHWAKTQSKVRYSLSSSEVPHFRLDSLPLTIGHLDLDGASHPRYAPLRRAIGNRYGVVPEQVVMANGTAMANFLALATLIKPGDEVIVEQPTYEPMLSAALFLGAEVKRVPRRADSGFQLDIGELETLATNRTRLILLTNVHNPSGALISEEDLRAIGAIAERREAYVLIDEVYLDSTVPPWPTSALLGPQFVITNSLTKVYGLSGLRCGWILAEPELAERMWRLNDLFGVNQPHQSEMLSCFAFEHLDKIAEGTAERLGRNRALFNEFVACRDDLDCMPADHGITAFPLWAGAARIASMRCFDRNMTLRSSRAAGSKCRAISVSALAAIRKCWGKGWIGWARRWTSSHEKVRHIRILSASRGVQSGARDRT